MWLTKSAREMCGGWVVGLSLVSATWDTAELIASQGRYKHLSKDLL